MKNFKHSGKVITDTQAGAVISGEPIQMGIKAGVPAGSFGAGVEGEFVMGGVFSLA